MKLLQYILYPLALVLLFCVSACNIEPFDGVLPEGVVLPPNPISCEEAIQNTVTATTDLASANESNYTILCNAYKSALQNQLNACGDPEGSIQTIINGLGDCSNNTGTDNCDSATTASNEALGALNNANDNNYTDLCNAYKVALQAQISTCGDSDGSIQLIIEDLGDCSNETDAETCDSATVASNIALDALNNGNDNNYTDLCNAYKLALQNQINVCGDDGSIQSIINDLGDCTQTETSGDYWPMAVGNSWVYSLEVDGASQDGHTMAIIGIADYQGFTNYVFDGFFSDVTATDGTGLENVDMNYYTRKDNGDYHLSVGEMTAELSGLYQIRQSGYDYIILKDYLGVGESWNYNFDVVTSYTPLDTNLPALPDATLNYNTAFEILEKDISMTVNGEVFSPVIKLSYKQTVTVLGSTSNSATVNYILYFAKDVGLVKVEGSLFDADDNITSNIVQELTSYTLY